MIFKQNWMKEWASKVITSVNMTTYDRTNNLQNKYLKTKQILK